MFIIIGLFFPELLSVIKTFFLGLDSDSEEPVSVCVEQNKCLFILCTLKAGHNYQQLLNLNFTEGEEVTFSIEGNREVHLTGV